MSRAEPTGAAEAGWTDVIVGQACCHAKNLARYEGLVGPGALEELRALAGRLRDVRICHINSTPFGGGVAELLASVVPMARSLGVSMDWRVIHGSPEFFAITKGLHNALQGGLFDLTEERRRRFLGHNQACAALLREQYDVYIVNDPQPVALRHFHGQDRAAWVWRCHVDSSAPNPGVWAFLRPFVEEYGAVVFTMERFVPPDIRLEKVELMAPAIDPLSTKNMDLPAPLVRAAVADFGIDATRPLLVQVSRFDPWKDPLGVIEVYRQVKRSRPEAQLALIGAMAGDDPEGWDILERINREAVRDPDLHVWTNMSGVGNMEVNAFQRAATVVIQKSLKEGFGLVISEALWKGTPVVAGNAGGIPLQMTGELARYLVQSVEECASKVGYLLDHPKDREALGDAGRRNVTENFLMPRLIRDELALIARLIDGPERARGGREGGEERDVRNQSATGRDEAAEGRDRFVR
jgi:trehalose synthase